MGGSRSSYDMITWEERYEDKASKEFSGKINQR